jgi:hypothetical protein
MSQTPATVDLDVSVIFSSSIVSQIQTTHIVSHKFPNGHLIPMPCVPVPAKIESMPTRPVHHQSAYAFKRSLLDILGSSTYLFEFAD